MTNINIITIDGPSGTGKGTVSLRLAKALQWHYLDSGCLYRVLAYQAGRQALDLNDPAALADLAADLTLSFAVDDELHCHVLLDGEDVSSLIRTQAIGQLASKASAYPEVRSALLALQRQFAKAPGLVTDGRDMGTVVFPTAQLKVFMTADPDIRAQRRYLHLKGKGIDVSLVTVQQELAERDKRDRERSVAPLKPAEDAYCIDTSTTTVDEVVSQIMALAKAKHLLAE